MASNVVPISLNTPIDVIRRILASDESAGLSNDDLLIASEVAYRNKDFSVAAEAMAILVGRGGDNAMHLSRLAQCSQLAGNLIERRNAVSSRDRERNPSHSLAYHGLRELLIRCGDFDGALDVARQHQATCGNSPQISMMIGSLLRARGDIQEALAVFHRLNKLSEPSEQALRAEAELAHEMGLFEQALGAATRAREKPIRRRPPIICCWRTSCTAAAGSAKSRHCCAALPRAIRRPPKSTGCSAPRLPKPAATMKHSRLPAKPRNCGLTLANIGTTPRPLPMFWVTATRRSSGWIERSRSIPAIPPLLVAQAHLLNGLGRLDQAIQVLRHAGRLFPDNSGIREMRLTLQSTALQREDGTSRLGPTSFKPLPRKSGGLAVRREPEGAIDELWDFVEAARVQARVVMALVARDLSFRTMHSRLGLLSSFIEPLIQVVMLGIVLTVFNRGLPPLGNNMFFFYSTGVLPLYIVLHVVTHSLNIYRENIGLLMVPRIRRTDLLLALAITELFIGGATTTLVYILFFTFGFGQGTPSIPTTIFAYFDSWLFGLESVRLLRY